MYQKKELRLLQMLDAMTSFPPSYDQKIWIMIIGETCQIPQV